MNKKDLTELAKLDDRILEIMARQDEFTRGDLQGAIEAVTRRAYELGRKAR